MQLPLSNADKALINLNFKDNQPLLDLMRKKMIAELDPNTPLGLNSDIWSQVKMDNTLPELVLLDVRAKKIVLNLLNEGLNKLADVDYEYKISMKDLVDFDDLSNPDDVYASVKGRNEFLMHVTSQMFSILGLAGRSGETIDSIKTRLATNSTK